MIETTSLSGWLNALLKPTPAPAAPTPAPQPPAAEPAPVVDSAPTAAVGPHPNLVALYDRARAREAALVQERLALEPKVLGAFGMLGALLIGTAIASQHVVWGLTQWHSPWHVALVALPNLAATALLLRGALSARRAIGELLAERKFPFAAQHALSDPLACVGKDPDGWLTALIQDVHAANQAQDLSLKKQHERYAGLVRSLTRLALVLAVQTGYNTLWQQAASAASKPGAPTGVVAAPVRAVPSPLASAIASPAVTASPLPSPAAVASAAPRAISPRRAVAPVAPRAAAPVQAVATPAATPTPLPTPTAKPLSAAPAVPQRAVAPVAAPAAETKPAAAPERKPVTAPVAEKKPAVAPEKKPAAPAQPAAPEPAPSTP